MLTELSSHAMELGTESFLSIQQRHFQMRIKEAKLSGASLTAMTEHPIKT
jgi:hypothetical protein